MKVGDIVILDSIQSISYAKVTKVGDRVAEARWCRIDYDGKWHVDPTGKPYRVRLSSMTTMGFVPEATVRVASVERLKEARDAAVRQRLMHRIKTMDYSGLSNGRLEEIAAWLEKAVVSYD